MTKTERHSWSAVTLMWLTLALLSVTHWASAGPLTAEYHLKGARESWSSSHQSQGLHRPRRCRCWTHCNWCPEWASTPIPGSEAPCCSHRCCCRCCLLEGKWKWPGQRFDHRSYSTSPPSLNTLLCEGKTNRQEWDIATPYEYFIYERVTSLTGLDAWW